MWWNCLELTACNHQESQTRQCALCMVGELHPGSGRGRSKPHSPLCRLLTACIGLESLFTSLAHRPQYFTQEAENDVKRGPPVRRCTKKKSALIMAIGHGPWHNLREHRVGTISRVRAFFAANPNHHVAYTLRVLPRWSFVHECQISTGHLCPLYFDDCLAAWSPPSS